MAQDAVDHRAPGDDNANVRDLNTRIEVIPSNVIGRWGQFERREYCQTDDRGVAKV